MLKQDFFIKTAYKLLRFFSKNKSKQYGFSGDTLPSDGHGTVIIANRCSADDVFMLLSVSPLKTCFIRSDLHYFTYIEKLLTLNFSINFPQYDLIGSFPVKAIADKLKNGWNVIIFPEYIPTYNGITGPLSSSVISLIKSLGHPVLTYRFSGAYLSAPFWSHTRRYGLVNGKIVNTYYPDRINTLDDDILLAKIQEDIYENAYMTQHKSPTKYEGRNLSEGIERFFFICPSCGRYNTISSVRNGFYCDCGLRGLYDEYGVLSGENMPFNNTVDWSRWIDRKFENDMSEADKFSVFTDNDITLYLLRDGMRNVVCTDKITADRNGIKIGNYSFAFSDISRMLPINHGKTLRMTFENRSWELIGTRFCAQLYCKLWEYFNKFDKPKYFD